MHRQLIGVVCLALLWPSTASADEQPGEPAPAPRAPAEAEAVAPTPEPEEELEEIDEIEEIEEIEEVEEPAPEGPEPAVPPAAVAPASPVLEETVETAEPVAYDQELGAFLGFEAGGRTSPGGLQLAGGHLYRLSEQDWLDSGVSFTFGSSSAACFRDRQGDFLCDHGLVGGFAGELFVGARRYFARNGQFAPFARAGVGVRVVSFADDEVRSLALPAFVGGGVRAEVADRVAITGGATVRAGVAFANRDLGIEPQLSLSVYGGVELALD